MTIAEPGCVERTDVGRILGWDESETPGPTLIVVAGLHANEPAGLIAAERTHIAIRENLPLGKGRVVTIRGNLAALREPADTPWDRPRYLDRDLNRQFTFGNVADAASVSESTERAAISETIASLVHSAEGRAYVLDLHTVSSDSPAFVALEDSIPARRFAMNFPLPKLLGIEEELPGLLMDYATNRYGCVACVVEGGRHDDPGSIDVHESIVLVAMMSLGLIGSTTQTSDGRDPREVVRAAGRGRDRHIYDVRQRVAITSNDFCMVDGALAFDRVHAMRTAVATQAGRDVVPDVSGYLFMPNRQPHPRVDDDAFFVVRRVGRIWLEVSRTARSLDILHAALPLVLPGVRRRPGTMHDLLGAPEIAAILRREIFHLLGYRIIRRSQAGPLPRGTSMIAAAAGIARSVTKMIVGVWAGGERSAMPRERDDDWIVRRRALDTGDLWGRVTDRTPPRHDVA